MAPEGLTLRISYPALSSPEQLALPNKVSIYRPNSSDLARVQGVREMLFWIFENAAGGGGSSHHENVDKKGCEQPKAVGKVWETVVRPFIEYGHVDHLAMHIAQLAFS